MSLRLPRRPPAVRLLSTAEIGGLALNLRSSHPPDVRNSRVARWPGPEAAAPRVRALAALVQRWLPAGGPKDQAMVVAGTLVGSLQPARARPERRPSHSWPRATQRRAVPV